MKLVRRLFTLLFLWLGSSVFISGPNWIVEAAEADKINVCYSSIAATSITTWVPKEAGIYKKYGLDVSIIYVAGAQAITTLISGDTQIVQGSGAAAALSRLSGSDLTVIATTINVIPMSLVTTSDIATAQDLKGKTFGVSRFGSLTDLGLKRAVSELGLDPNKDIKMIQTGGVPENLLSCSRHNKRRAHFVTDFGTGEGAGLQRIHESGESQISLSGNRAGDD